MSQSPAKFWSVIDILKQTWDYFAKCGVSTPRLDAELLLAHCLQKDRVGLYLDFEYVLDSDELARFRYLVRRRGKREPVAYITGYKDFWSMRIAVTPDVLIPRPETEVLVEEVVRILRDEPSCRILDVGTGSGAIALALAKELPCADLVACDISERALAIARHNALSCGFADRVSFFAGCICQAPPSDMPIDAIVANPPYIASGEIEILDPEIKRYEPRLALDGGDDGLDFYRACIPHVHAFLKPRGLIAFEIGATQGEAVAALLQDAGMFDLVRIINDYAHKQRVVTARVR